MQYVGKVGGYVYNQWNSLNPSTFSGAIDVIVIEHPNKSLHCSPWHVRFGKFQIIKPLQKKVDLYVNGIKTDLPMKLGECGEAFFVFEADKSKDFIFDSMLTSPVQSSRNSNSNSPLSLPKDNFYSLDGILDKFEPEPLDLNESKGSCQKKCICKNIDSIKNFTFNSLPNTSSLKSKNNSFVKLNELTFETAKKISEELNIKSKVDSNGDILLDVKKHNFEKKKIDETSDMFEDLFFERFEKLQSLQFSKKHNCWKNYISRERDGNLRIPKKNINSFSSLKFLTCQYSDMDQHPVIDNDYNFDGATSFDFKNDICDEKCIYNYKHDSEHNEIKFNNSDFSYKNNSTEIDNKVYFKTLRLTSQQLQKMNLHYGENSLLFKLSQGNSQIVSSLFLWKSTTPLVISDIDGTITKSDALGHVLNLFGKDWTHVGVANLFHDIESNGYNIIYLTARSVGQADSTRQYLRGIVQDGKFKLPIGPVILSPDRTIAALKREVIFKKPEKFKMACLNDIKSLYQNSSLSSKSIHNDDRSPFYAGFGNRVTDAISYRSVEIPNHRIFTINSCGEVHMELLELAGYKSSYLHIDELVDHFFPPVKESFNNNFDFAYNLNNFDSNQDTLKNVKKSSLETHLLLFDSSKYLNSDINSHFQTEEKFNDIIYWREPINFNNLSDLEFENQKEISFDDSPNSYFLNLQSNPSSKKINLKKKTDNNDKIVKNLDLKNLNKPLYTVSTVFQSKSLPTIESINSNEKLYEIVKYENYKKCINTSLFDSQLKKKKKLLNNLSYFDDSDYTDDYTDDYDDDYDDEVKNELSEYKSTKKINSKTINNHTQSLSDTNLTDKKNSFYI